MRYSRRCTSNGFRAAGPRCGGFSSVMISPIKKSLCAAERHRKDVARARRRWIQQQGFLDTTRLVFIDETAITTNMVRVRGRCPRGERLVSHVPQGERKTITFIAALRHNKMTAPMVIERAMDGGLHSSAVVGLLGNPSETRHYTYFGIKVDQLIFMRPGEPEISTFFVENHLVAKGFGQGVPIDIFRIVLPSPSDTAAEDSDERSIGIGSTASSVKALYGAARLDVEYRFNGQPAEHAIYETQPGGSFVDVTFVDGVVTEFADIGRLPDDPIFQGR